MAEKKSGEEFGLLLTEGICNIQAKVTSKLKGSGRELPSLSVGVYLVHQKCCPIMGDITINNQTASGIPVCFSQAISSDITSSNLKSGPPFI